MRTTEKRILMNRLFANSPNVSQPLSDTELAMDGIFEKPDRMESVGTQARQVTGFVSEDACSSDEWHDLGGEG